MAHIIGAGVGIASAYTAAKFAVRGLTQAAGIPFSRFSSVFVGFDEGLFKPRNSPNTASP